MEPRPIAPAQPLEQRILLIEGRYRRLQTVLAVVGLVACARIAAHFLPGPSTLVASRWLLLDRSQAVRAEMTTEMDGGVLLRLNNANGKARAMWKLERDGSGVLRMSDEQGFNRFEVAMDREGTPLLVLTGADGHTRTRLGLYEAGSPGIMLFDPARKLAWSAP